MTKAQPMCLAEWSVWRQDDNGTQVQIESGLRRQEAETKVAEFEKRGHKQFYWCQPQLAHHY